QALDSSGNNNTGTLTNGPTWQQANNCKTGGCLSFDGVDDYVSVTDSSSLNFGTDQFTVLLYGKAQTNQGTAMFINKGSRFDANIAGWLIGFATSPYVVVSSDVARREYSISPFTPNAWIQLGITREVGGNTYLIVNGSRTLITSTAYNVTNTGYNLWIGKSNYYNSVLNGLIDDVRVYNRALSASEILVLYNATK
ncbi:MAG: LamG domain-containing protein, partial [Candidatus Paceibacterota bacterium]